MMHKSSRIVFYLIIQLMERLNHTSFKLNSLGAQISLESTVIRMYVRFSVKYLKETSLLNKKKQITNITLISSRLVHHIKK